MREAMPHTPASHGRPTSYEEILRAAREVGACELCRRNRDEQERLFVIVHGSGPLSREEAKRLWRMLYGSGDAAAVPRRQRRQKEHR